MYTQFNIKSVFGYRYPPKKEEGFLLGYRFGATSDTVLPTYYIIIIIQYYIVYCVYSPTKYFPSNTMFNKSRVLYI